MSTLPEAQQPQPSTQPFELKALLPGEIVKFGLILPKLLESILSRCERDDQEGNVLRCRMPPLLDTTPDGLEWHLALLAANLNEKELTFAQILGAIKTPSTPHTCGELMTLSLCLTSISLQGIFWKEFHTIREHVKTLQIFSTDGTFTTHLNEWLASFDDIPTQTTSYLDIVDGITEVLGTTLAIASDFNPAIKDLKDGNFLKVAASLYDAGNLKAPDRHAKIQEFVSLYGRHLQKYSDQCKNFSHSAGTDHQLNANESQAFAFARARTQPGISTQNQNVGNVSQSQALLDQTFLESLMTRDLSSQLKLTRIRIKLNALNCNLIQQNQIQIYQNTTKLAIDVQLQIIQWIRNKTSGSMQANTLISALSKSSLRLLSSQIDLKEYHLNSHVLEWVRHCQEVNDLFQSFDIDTDRFFQIGDIGIRKRVLLIEVKCPSCLLAPFMKRINSLDFTTSN